jgi:DNA-directed RNA polymerase specialized sigma24 family protein
VIAGLDPWDIVDEAWSAMAEGNFSSKGPFVAHAVVVARNKAVDAMRRWELGEQTVRSTLEAERMSRRRSGESARDLAGWVLAAGPVGA